MDNESFIAGAAIGSVATFGILLGVGYWLYINSKNNKPKEAIVIIHQNQEQQTSSSQQQSTSGSQQTGSNIPAPPAVNVITTEGFQCEPLSPIPTIIGEPIKCKVTETQTVEECKVVSINGKNIIVDCKPVSIQPPTKWWIQPMTTTVPTIG